MRNRRDQSHEFSATDLEPDRLSRNILMLSSAIGRDVRGALLFCGMPIKVFFACGSLLLGVTDYAVSVLRWRVDSV